MIMLDYPILTSLQWLMNLHYWYDTLPHILNYLLATLPIIFLGASAYYLSIRFENQVYWYEVTSITFLIIGWFLLPYNLASYILCAGFITLPLWGIIIDLVGGHK